MLRGRNLSYPQIGRLMGKDHTSIMAMLQRRGSYWGSKRLIPLERVLKLRSEGMTWLEVSDALGPVNGRRFALSSLRSAVSRYAPG
jgi:hypothetical protein